MYDYVCVVEDADWSLVSIVPTDNFKTGDGIASGGTGQSKPDVVTIPSETEVETSAETSQAETITLAEPESKKQFRPSKSNNRKKQILLGYRK